MTLTAIAVKEAKPLTSGKRRWMHDREGLYLVVQPSGSKAWHYRGRIAGGPIVKKHLGDVTAQLDLKAARHLASEARKAARSGVRYEPPKPEAEAAHGPTVANSWAIYVNGRTDWRASTKAEHQRIFDKHISPKIGSRPIAGIIKADMLPVYDAAGRRGPAARNKCVAVLTGFFRWAHEERDLVAKSPMVGLKQKRGRSRSRVLTDSEIVEFWKACDSLDTGNEATVCFGAMFKMLLLTGCRRSEVAGIADAEIDRSEWVIPAERTKNGLPFLVHLTKTAKAILSGLPRFDDCTYLFGPTGETGSFGFSKAKERLDKLAKIAAGWRLHDLRRTYRTGLGKLGVPEYIAERMMNHTPAELVGTYDLHHYAAEMAKGWRKWEKNILSLVNQKKRSRPKVVDREPHVHS